MRTVAVRHGPAPSPLYGSARVWLHCLVFVTVVGEFSQDDHRVAAHELFRRYGLKEIVTNVFESVSIMESTLTRLKRDVDRVTDYYDTIRFYQYPLQDTLVISTLTKKKWRRTLVKRNETT